MPRPAVSSELIDKLKLYLVELNGRDNKIPGVGGFRQELLDWRNGNLEDKTKEEFIKRFGKVEIPSKAWFDKRENFPTWRKRLKESQENPSELESPWTFGSLKKHPIREEAISYLLHLQNLPVEGEKEPWNPITIRDALWFSRLCFSLELTKERWFDSLRVCVAYATKEFFCEQAGVPFETLELDRLFFQKQYKEFFAKYQNEINNLDKKLQKAVNNARQNSSTVEGHLSAHF